MLFHYFLTFKENTVLSILNALPFTAAPSFFTDTLPEIFQKIMTFNDYLPIYEIAGTVLICLLTTFGWKIVKVVASIVIDLGA